MICEHSSVLLPWATEMLEAGLTIITNGNKTNPNKTETKQQEEDCELEEATTICLGFLIKATGFHPTQQDMPLTVMLCLLLQQSNIAGATPKQVVFHCPVGEKVTRFRELTDDSAVIAFLV